MPNWYRKLFICPLCGKRHGISLLKRRKYYVKNERGKSTARAFVCKSCGGKLKTSFDSIDFRYAIINVLWLIPITLQVLAFVKYDMYADIMRWYASETPAFNMTFPAQIALVIWFACIVICLPMVPFEGQPDGQKKKRTRDRTVSQMLKNEPTYPDGIKGVWLRYKWLWLSLMWVVWMYLLGLPFDTFKGLIKDIPSLFSVVYRNNHWFD